MLIVIKSVLTKEQLASFGERLKEAEWADGKLTAGVQSGGVKNNQQLPELGPTARQLGQEVLNALGQSPLFLAAALPQRIYPPLFNRYQGGQHFGVHVDNAIRPITGTREVMRTDLSATLFLADPESYDGGELEIETEFGAQAVKLSAGDMVLYPASSLHQVKPVTRGARLACFFWVQSLVADSRVRGTLFDLDQSIQQLGAELGVQHQQVVTLTGVYHNFLRMQASI